ncbi:MAG: hypothetical protein QOI74_2479, partial [Micromonosporaceae bacterium]|nr:hypothetical protein [Micromonosporaceae bacterium]
TFAVDWAPNVVTWFVDGIQYSRHTNADTSGNPWAFNHPFFLLLNVAVGGAFPGNPDATSTYPQQMLIDYIRVFGQDTGAPAPPATTPPGAPGTPPTTTPPTTPPSGTAWAVNTAYSVGQVVTYNGGRYQCRQAHTSLPGWEPTNAVALWQPI